MSSEPGRVLPHGLAALRERDYALYFVGHITSHVGTWIEQTAVAWILYELTDSTILLGLGGLSRAAPTILLALLGGAIADRLPRRSLLLATESTMLVLSSIMAALAWTGELQFWHLYLLNLTSGTLSAFSTPARHAMFPALVPRTAIPSAILLNSLAARGAGFVGPTIAGLALAYSGYALPFMLNAASFVAMLAALLAMREPTIATGRPAQVRGLSRDMMEGVRFIWHNPLLKSVLALEVLMGVLGHNTALVTIIARDVLGAGPQGLGSLLSALAAGALAGMLSMVVFHTEQRGRVILVTGTLYSLLLIGFGLSGSLALSLALLFVLGLLDSIWSVSRNTVVQLAVPDEIRGRAMSAVILVTRGSTPLGHFNSGLLASLIGPAGTAVLGGVLIGAGVLAAGARVPALGSSGRDAKGDAGDSD